MNVPDSTVTPAQGGDESAKPAKAAKKHKRAEEEAVARAAQPAMDAATAAAQQPDAAAGTQTKKRKVAHEQSDKIAQKDRSLPTDVMGLIGAFSSLKTAATVGDVATKSAVVHAKESGGGGEEINNASTSTAREYWLGAIEGKEKEAEQKVEQLVSELIAAGKFPQEFPKSLKGVTARMTHLFVSPLQIHDRLRLDSEILKALHTIFPNLTDLRVYSASSNDQYATDRRPSPIDDRCLETIVTQWDKLQTLDLTSGTITDRGLALVASLKQLRNLDMVNCSSITPDAIRQLKSQNPHLTITHNFR